MSKTFNKVPFGQKVAFGLGMLANQMFPAALGIFMVVLIQNLGFPTWMYAVLFFFPRIFDTFTDPIMGFISDNTKSRWGRRRQYVLIGAIIMGIAYILMWQLYKEDGLSYNFTYFMIWSFVFYLGLTIFSVPYVAMGYEMSDDFHERTNIMAVAQWIGQWAWVIAPWFWVVMYDPSWFEGGADEATRTLAIWVAIPCTILAMIPAFFIKSKSTKNDDSLTPLTLKNIGGSLKKILDGAIEAFKIEAFRKLCYSTFLIFNAFNTVAGFSFFIIVYYLFNGVTGPEGSWIWPTLFGCIGALSTTFMVIPIVTRMSKKMGKKNAFLVSQGISIIGYILLWFLFIPGKPFLILLALPFFSFGIGALFTLMMSMTADVCDLDELNSGKRREGIFGAMYWWMVKFGFAIAGGLSALIMFFVGFSPDLPVQPDGAITGLRIFFSGLPILGTLAAMYIMRNYDLTETKALEISAELAKRKEKPTSFYQTDKLGSLVASGLQIDTSSEIDFNSKTDADIKALFSTHLNKGLHGLCF
ncbi:MAG: MFS transporter, partial [Flavobacteriaceae bacterium]|nr:MFS transporter [Flavobacteriaceae bacterium]